jgi:hypothetical protein
MVVTAQHAGPCIYFISRISSISIIMNSAYDSYPIDHLDDSFLVGTKSVFVDDGRLWNVLIVVVVIVVP